MYKPSVVAIAVAGVVVSLWARHVILENGREDAARVLQIEAASLRLEITSRIDSYIAALERMANRWSVRQGTPREEWEADAEHYLEDMVGTHALGFWDADRTVRWVMPRGHSALTQLMQEQLASYGRSAARSMGRAATEVQSVSLPDGRPGFLVLVPLYSAQFDGYLLTLSIADEIFPPLVREAGVHGFTAAVYDDTDQVVFMPPEAVACADGCQSRAEVFQIQTLPHRLRVWARPGQSAGSREIANAVLIAGFFLSGLLAVALASAERARRESGEAKRVTQALREEVDEHRRTQSALEAARAQYVDLYNHSPDMQLSLDTDGTVLQCNHTLAVALGRARSDVIGTPVETHFLTEDRDAVRTLPVRLTPSQPEVRDLALRIRDVSGSTFDVSANAILASDVNRDGRPVCRVTLRDVTEQRRLQRLEETNRELTRSNTDLEQFAYAASHDLREPLRMVSSYATLLSKRYGAQLDERADKYIAYMVEGADRMQSLIGDLLAFSRIGTRTGESERFGLREALDEASQNLTMAIQEGNAVVTTGTLPEIVGDRSQFVQLFQNLVGNALKYRRPDCAPTIHVDAEHSDDHWVISVRDNGIGIAPEHVGRIFGIFQRLHGRGKYPGNGLGLALCKKIVERHGGLIWVDPGRDHGSVFRFTVLAQTAPAPSPPDPQDAPITASGDRLPTNSDVFQATS